MVHIEGQRTLATVPDWATRQRRLIELLDGVPDPFLDRYFEDGEPYWPPEDHVGIDGGDDLYEGFHNWPLAYIVGADEGFLDGSKTAFDGIVDRLGRTETPFGHPMAVDEYEQCRDWFHQGEANIFFYNLCLATPSDSTTRERAEHFAGLYLPDSETGNYDAENNVVTASMTGSMGPEYCDLSAFTEDHPYDHRYGWGGWGLPFDDVDGIDSIADARDPANRGVLLDALAERVERGDTPLNLGVAALMANAFMMTGDETYREWVREYVDGWRERTRENDGVVPDNVGLSGEVGEYTGAPYGGFYGWTWHGWIAIGPALAVGATTAAMLEGDDDYLDMLRTTVDAMIENGIERDDRLYVPHKHGETTTLQYRGNEAGQLGASMLREPDGSVREEDGWYSFKPMRRVPSTTHLWVASRDPADEARLSRVDPGGAPPSDTVRANLADAGKFVGGHEHAWLAYLNGEYPDYPAEILEADTSHVRRRAAAVEADDRTPEELAEFGEHYLSMANPVALESLLHLTMGAPQQVYNGGLLHATLRHFDPVRERPGLPPDVAALVRSIAPDDTRVTFVNTGTSERQVRTQAGAFAEHRFERVRKETTGRQRREREVDARTVAVSLPARGAVDLELEWERLANDPTYAVPWEREAAD